MPRLRIEPATVERVIDQMHRLADQFMAETGKEPWGYILGPEEWLMFKTALQSMTPFTWLDYELCDKVRRFRGKDVIVKTTPGLDVAIDPSMATQFLSPASEAEKA